MASLTDTLHAGTHHMGVRYKDSNGSVPHGHQRLGLIGVGGFGTTRDHDAGHYAAGSPAAETNIPTPVNLTLVNGLSASQHRRNIL